jgi:hypothetical protein
VLVEGRVCQQLGRITIQPNVQPIVDYSQPTANRPPARSNDGVQDELSLDGKAVLPIKRHPSSAYEEPNGNSGVNGA